jgi:hypothetical protein
MAAVENVKQMRNNGSFWEYLSIDTTWDPPEILPASPFKWFLFSRIIARVPSVRETRMSRCNVSKDRAIISGNRIRSSQ